MNETKIVSWEGPTDIDLQKMSLLLDINCVIELTNGKENFFSQGLQIDPKKLSPILVMSRINSSEVKSVRMSFNNDTVTNVNDFLDLFTVCLTCFMISEQPGSSLQEDQNLRIQGRPWATTWHGPS